MSTLLDDFDDLVWADSIVIGPRTLGTWDKIFTWCDLTYGKENWRTSADSRIYFRHADGSTAFILKWGI